ncbi:MAG: DUF4157 domain-containing protein [Ferruginibacter sp.]
MANKISYKIKENSWLAKIAAKKLGKKDVAMVLGNTIHLWNTTEAGFLNDKQWVKHELCHVEQYKRYGFLNFLARYLWESIRKGYQNNKYEVEARNAEKNME